MQRSGGNCMLFGCGFPSENGVLGPLEQINWGVKREIISKRNIEQKRKGQVLRTGLGSAVEVLEATPRIAVFTQLPASISIRTLEKRTNRESIKTY